MPRIDKLTIDKIMDATNIVDVVGDFVSLKKRGANHWGLCPFHNDRSPSFSVNAAKGIFKCFSCGKAGSAVSFLMDLEGMTYVEAIKWLGKKYNIEIKEREMTGAEREAEAEREAMYAVNEYALKHFETTLADTPDGRDIGLAYFRERGISDAMIRRFHLGYALDRSDDLITKAVKAGYSEKYLVDTGLCIRTDSGRVYDRFKGRVIYPVHSLSGRVVAFGGRTLRKEKTVPKYVNSPESIIYSKSRELYGMYQARSAIARKKECILVEGYMDVISMHQVGIENVVASSGTSLTEGQVAMIKRFADTVTLIYDSDAAGIKASLRGIDMFVAAGISLRLVLLPEGEDPDSFAQSHSSAEVEEYITTHSVDLIGFKTDILLRDSAGDPRRRSEAINDILHTVSLIPDMIERSLYIDECARKVGVDAKTLAAQVKVFIARRKEDEYNARERDRAVRSLHSDVQEPSAAMVSDGPGGSGPVADTAIPAKPVQAVPRAVSVAEEDVLRYALRYGTMYLCDVMVGDDLVPMTAISYIEQELKIDGIGFRTPGFAGLWEAALRVARDEWPRRHEERAAALEAVRISEMEQFRAGIIAAAGSVEDIKNAETQAQAEADARYDAALDEFDTSFVRDMLLRSDDRSITDRVVALTTDRVVMSRMHPKVNVREDVCSKLPMAIYALKGILLKEEIAALTASLATASENEAAAIMLRIKELKETSMEFDRYNGEMVVTPFRLS